MKIKKTTLPDIPTPDWVMQTESEEDKQRQHEKKMFNLQAAENEKQRKHERMMGRR